MESFFEYLLEPYLDYNSWQIILEIFAALLGIMSVVFAMLKKIWVYPTGIISTGVYVFLLFGWGLYGDMMINAYYFGMSIYGWYMWAKIDENNEHIPVSIMHKKEKFYAALIFLASIICVLIVYYFKPYIESGFMSEKIIHLNFDYNWIEYVDSITTAVFFVGMWLMARKKLENWIFWIVGDIISVPMYIVKGYAITAGQYFIFLIPAVIGLILWYKTYKSQKQT